MRAASIALLLLLVTRADARELMNPAADGHGQHRVYATSGVDPTFTSGIGYAFDLPVAAIARSVELSADLSAPWFVFDGHHYQLDVGARTTALRWHDLRLVGRLHLQLTGGKNWVHEATSLGFETSILAGMFRPHAFIAAEVSFGHYALTYLEHSDVYRATQFDDVVDGWYANTGGRIVVAVQGGHSVSAGWEVALRLGIAWTEALGPPQGLPYFVDVALTKRF